ncbi:MAG: prepilin-type N-terminal cleavage/methylation domain-containing protein [bacterium]
MQIRNPKSEIRKSKRLIPNSKAFTIIELIMVIVITGIIAGITAMLLLQVMNVYSFVTVREVVLSDGELAMGRMSREIRQIEDAESIYTADAHEIDFEDAYQERIRFWLDSNTIKRNDDGLASSDLTTLQFQYRDKDNIVLSTPVAIPANIKRIQINLTIKKGDEEIALQSQVYPRNLK